MIVTKKTEREAKGRALAPGLLLAALMAAWLVLAASPAHAATTFTVNSVGDDGDQNPGDGSCFTGVVLVIGDECTLRAAIEEANATSGADTINFGIPTTGERNVISGNNSSGVFIFGANVTGNRILSNSIFANGELGIDLGGNGVTANDPADADTGPNNLQNFPVLTKAKMSGKKNTAIEGTLNNTSSTTFAVQFFSSPEADPSGNGEGKTFLGSKSVKTGASGNATFAATTPKVPKGQVVTATATNARTGDTSEFSNAVAAR